MQRTRREKTTLELVHSCMSPHSPVCRRCQFSFYFIPKKANSKQQQTKKKTRTKQLWEYFRPHDGHRFVLLFKIFNRHFIWLSFDNETEFFHHPIEFKTRPLNNKNIMTMRKYLRDGDGEIGSEQLGALPEAIERRNDGARENIFKNLHIHQID